jgi:hypothetical protein
LIPEGYTTWQPEKGQHFFMASTVAEDVLDRVLAGEGELRDPDVRRMMVVGSKKEQWVIPVEVARTLDNFQPVRDDGPIENFWVQGQAAWKQWVLLNPLRAIRYNLNNMSGDLDITIGYDPAIVKGLKSAAADLWDYQVRNRSTAALRKEMQDATRRGVVGSGLSIAEIPDINRTAAFQALSADHVTPGVMQAVEKYWGSVKAFTTWRENTLRLAAYRYFKAELAKGKKLYGVSDRMAVDALYGAGDSDAVAARLARDLLGDYGNISEAGQWIRRHMIPFYSWIEINAPRYYRLLKNMPHDENVRGKNVAASAGLTLGKAAVGLALRVNLLYMLSWLWNHLLFGDEEEQLRREGRKAHLIFGRREDGSIRWIRFEGAWADALKWFALEDFPADVRDLVTGKADVIDKVNEAIKAPADRIIGSLEPVTKTAYELFTGRSIYPTIFGRGKSMKLTGGRPIRDKGEHFFRTLSLDWLYNKVVGKPQRKGMGSIADKILFYRTDPGEAAYYETRERVMDWQKKQGDEVGSVTPTARQNALYYYKLALRWDDDEAAAKWWAKYLELGGSEKGRDSSIDRSAPLGGLSEKKRKEFERTLSERDRETLKQAEEWFNRSMRR